MVRKPARCKYSRVFSSPPHRAQTLAALRKRNGHAVHARNSVQKSAERMRDIILHVARSLDVLHQIHAFGFQRALDTAQNIQWLGLVMHGVKGCNAVKLFRLGDGVEIAQVRRDELQILQPLP